jgi:hypothetical protein
MPGGDVKTAHWEQCAVEYVHLLAHAADDADGLAEVYLSMPRRMRLDLFVAVPTEVAPVVRTDSPLG